MDNRPNCKGLHTWEQVLGYDPKKPPPKIPVTPTVRGDFSDIIGGQIPMPVPSEIICEGP